MIWSIALALLAVFVFLKISDVVSTESRNRRRRRKSSQPVTYKGNRSSVRFS